MSNKKKTVARKRNTKKVAGPRGPKPAANVKKPHFVVCIGASAGGLNALSELVSQLPASINAAVFVVLHLSKSAIGEILAHRIRQHTKLHCQIAGNNLPVLPGHIYIAPPDVHLLIEKRKMVLGHGPTENRFRPSIDVLFRSAAASCGERVIGIVLTGFLNDGTSGMWAIRQSGGYCIVQDPNEAEYPDMPLSVLETMEVGRVATLREMSGIILDIIKTKKIKGVVPPTDIVAESTLSAKAATSLEQVRSLGEKTIYACPDCGGGLWKVKNGNIQRYRCHIGHSYTEKDLELKQSEHIEQTLWIAVRMMEERKLLLKKIATENKEKGLDKLSAFYLEQAAKLEIHIENMKELLFAVNKD